MQTLCVGQGATFGVLFGLGLGPWVGSWFGSWFSSDILPFVLAILAAVAAFDISNRMVRVRSASKNTYFSFLFTVLVGLSYLVSALFPSLETHMSHIFFGDLATLSNFHSGLSLVLSLIGFILMWKFRFPFTNQAFENSVFGWNEKGHAGRRLFQTLSFIAICYGVQFTGFLFTMGCLFIPTSIMSYSSLRGLDRHLLGAALLASISTAVGFVLSLAFSQLPTVPTIIVVMVTLGWIFDVFLMPIRSPRL